ncbi:MAG: choice-of-anchor Q domain-containing protein, partial [Pseudobdellovibrionaceae bacterium]
GTTFAVCENKGRRWIGIELRSSDVIIERLKRKNIQFYNNTFYDVGPFSGYATTGTPGDSTGTVFKNNIFVQINGYNPSDYSGGMFTWTGFPAWTFANNFFSTLSGAALTNFDYTEQVGGINGGAINFANAAANDFSIKSGSAAIDKGTTLSGFNYDYVRTARPQGSAWDIGAYEYVTGSTTALLPPTNLRVQ